MTEHATRARSGAGTATLEILGEDVTRKVAIPAGGAPANDLLRAAGLAPRDQGWDLYVDGGRSSTDTVIEAGRETSLKWIPRTRGA